MELLNVGVINRPSGTASVKDSFNGQVSTDRPQVNMTLNGQATWVVLIM